jgi:hypothetical protein
MIGYTFMERDLEGFATDVKNRIVHFLHKEGIIDDEQVVDLTNNYALVYRKPSFFRRFFPKKAKSAEEHADLIIVRQCDLSEEAPCTESQKTSKENATPDSSSETTTETVEQQCDAS